MRLPIVVSMLAALWVPVGARQGAVPTAAARQVEEANKTFTYDGAPINPRAVQELLTWLSDGGPGPVAVDLASQRSNRYFGKFAREKDGRVTIDRKTTDLTAKPDENKGSFSYERLGTLVNGIHVLETWDREGGTGVFMDLLLVKIAVDFEYDDNGARQDRVVMTRFGEITLGDRYSGVVTVKGDTIEIGAGEAGKKPKTVRIS